MNMHEATERFLGGLALTRSTNTVRTYRTVMTHLINWAEEAGVEQIEEVSPSAFMTWLTAGRELSDGSIRSYITALSAMSTWLHAEEILANGHYARFRRRIKAMRGRPKPPAPPKLPKQGVVQAIVDRAHEQTPGTRRQVMCRLRTAALVETLRSTGCRVSEIQQLLCQDLGDKTARVKGKGDKERVVFFDNRAWASLQTFLDLRGSRRPKDPVFARHDRRAHGIQPMSTTAMRNAISELCQAARVEPITPHQFRHHFATKVLAATHDLAATQDLLGHASPVTTRIYAKLDKRHLQAVHAVANL